MYKVLMSVILLVTCFAFAAAQNRPHIIYIMADDLGYADLSGYGRKDYQTPNLDKLAAQGMRFSNAYAGAPLCTPTRTSFMTGRYPARTPVGLREPLDWVAADSVVGLSPDYTSLATLLKRSGYATYLVGKWHLGFSPAYNPRNNGFDEFFGSHGGGVDYISHTDPKGNHDLYENDKPVSKKGYMTDLILDKTLDILQRSHSKPFFMAVMFTAPHWPWQAPGDSVYALGNRNWREGGSPKTYAAMMKSLDDAVGKIMQVLDERQLSSNTVVIFTSDNGGERFSDMGGLTGRKPVLSEGGIKVPAFIRWPGNIQTGSHSQQPVITMDWTATILALANARPDRRFPLDGVNLLPVFSGRKALFDRTFYWRVTQRNQQKAMREGKWKYLKDEKGEYLFDLSTDAFEKSDVKEMNKAVFERLKKKYARWEKSVLKPVPLQS